MTRTALFLSAFALSACAPEAYDDIDGAAVKGESPGGAGCGHEITWTEKGMERYQPDVNMHLAPFCSSGNPVTWDSREGLTIMNLAGVEIDEEDDASNAAQYNSGFNSKAIEKWEEFAGEFGAWQSGITWLSVTMPYMGVHSFPEQRGMPCKFDSAHEPDLTNAYHNHQYGYTWPASEDTYIETYVTFTLGEDYGSPQTMSWAPKHKMKRPGTTNFPTPTVLWGIGSPGLNNWPTGYEIAWSTLQANGFDVGDSYTVCSAYLLPGNTLNQFGEPDDLWKAKARTAVFETGDMSPITRADKLRAGW